MQPLQSPRRQISKAERTQSDEEMSTVVKPHAFMWAYRDVDFVDISIVGDNRKRAIATLSFLIILRFFRLETKILLDVVAKQPHRVDVDVISTLRERLDHLFRVTFQIFLDVCLNKSLASGPAGGDVRCRRQRARCKTIRKRTSRWKIAFGWFST